VDACFARTHVSGAPLSPRGDGHAQENGSDSEESGSEEEEEEEKCARCGRPGHSARQCYARRRVDGNAL
jgi:hypothetical protein